MKEISFAELNMNPYNAIGRDWMLVTAGTKERGYNTMTASWGHFGCLWNSGPDDGASSVIYVRPQRLTKHYIDREEYYTLSFYPESFREKLLYLGTHSTRYEDKMEKTGMIPVFEDDWTWFEGAELVLVCRKLYHAPLAEEGFVDKTLLDEVYPRRDLHEMYIGEIVKVYVKD